MKKLLVIIGFFITCKKEDDVFISCQTPTNDISICSKLIVGKWNWSYEKYFNRITKTYVYKTPVTESYTKALIFIDNTNAIIYQSNTTNKNLTYEITGFDKITSFSSDHSISIIILYDKTNHQIYDYVPFRICNDTLSLSYQILSDTKGEEKWSKEK